MWSRCFGIGGLIYAALVKLLVRGLGQTGLAVTGGLVLAAAYLELAIGAVWWLAPIATTAIGLGFYMLHNTLQTNATQMTPQARGTAVGLFSSALYIGQTAGVAAGALVIDRAGAAPLFLGGRGRAAGARLWFVGELKRYRRVGLTPAGEISSDFDQRHFRNGAAPRRCVVAAARRLTPAARSAAWPWRGAAPAAFPAAASPDRPDNRSRACCCRPRR